MMTDQDLMRKSLEGMDLPTRVRNNLIGLAAYGDIRTWMDVVFAMKSDSESLAHEFLRVPGAGRKSWNLLKAYMEEHGILRGLDHTGRTLWLTADDAQRMRNALDAAYSNASIPQSVAAELQVIKAALSAEIIKIEIKRD